MARVWFDTYGFWTIFVAGFSPIPYKVFTIAAGVAVLNFPAFVLASVIGRGARFFLVAGVVRYAGVRYEASLLKHIERIGWGVVIASVLVIGFLMARG
jgi:membrane protein YqaA with SNARE-associated domain